MVGLLNFVLIAAFDIPGYFVASKVLAPAFGNARAAALALGSCGLLLLATACADLVALPAVVCASLALCAKCAAAAAFPLLYLLPVDAYPSRIRGAALGLSMCLARLGGLLAPLAASTLSLRAADTVCGALVVGAAAAVASMGGRRD